MTQPMIVPQGTPAVLIPFMIGTWNVRTLSNTSKSIFGWWWLQRQTYNLGIKIIFTKRTSIKISDRQSTFKCLFYWRTSTYWPTDINKTPDLIDFFIGKGLASTNVSCDSCYDLSSDHSPIILLLEKDIKRTCYLLKILCKILSTQM